MQWVTGFQRTGPIQFSRYKIYILNPDIKPLLTYTEDPPEFNDPVPYIMPAILPLPPPPRFSDNSSNEFMPWCLQCDGYIVIGHGGGVRREGRCLHDGHGFCEAKLFQTTNLEREYPFGVWFCKFCLDRVCDYILRNCTRILWDEVLPIQVEYEPDIFGGSFEILCNYHARRSRR